MGQEQNFELLHSGWGGDLYSALMLLVIVGLLKWIEKWHFASELGNLESERSEREQS
jgi:hypothetical protein